MINKLVNSLIYNDKYLCNFAYKNNIFYIPYCMATLGE